MSDSKRVKELEQENDKLLFKVKELSEENGDLRNILDSIDEYRTLKEYEGDLVIKSEELRQGARKRIKSLKSEIFDS